jgi:4Fe-4S ferredoxin iron-sulfur binding domain protein
VILVIIKSLRNLLSLPLTDKKGYVPKENRGKVMWDMEKCIFCRLCERSCPTSAITTVKGESQSVERFKCIVCGECARICPTHTISMFSDYTVPSRVPVTHTFRKGSEKFSYDEIRKY